MWLAEALTHMVRVCEVSASRKWDVPILSMRDAYPAKDCVRKFAKPLSMQYMLCICEWLRMRVYVCCVKTLLPPTKCLFCVCVHEYAKLVLAAADGTPPVLCVYGDIYASVCIVGSLLSVK